MNKLTITGGSHYTDEKRREAAATYLVLGNLRATGKQCRVNERTLSDWVKSEWWHDLLQTLHYEKSVELDAKLSEVIDKALLNLTDRLDYGDLRIRPDGTTQRVPVSARDCAIIAAVGFDKRQILRNQPTSITGDSTQRLHDLAARLLVGFEDRGKQAGTIGSGATPY